MMPQIVITIDAEGKATVDAHGFKGSGCKDATAAIERALGVVTDDQVKPEFRQSASQSVQNRAVQQ